MPTDSAGPRVAAGYLLMALLVLVACDGSTGPSTPPPSITTTSLPDGVVGEPYSEAVNATGGDGEFSWSLVEGTLPPGLDLSVGDLGGDGALITGTPETAGTFSFGIRVADGAGRADTAELSILVTQPPGPVSVVTPRLAPALAGADYEVALQASGGDHVNFQWSVVDGSLPAGLELTSAGRFQGIPESPETTSFTVEVVSAEFSDRKSFTLVVVPHDPDRYNITVFPVVDVPGGLEDNVREAVRRWEAAIIGDLPGGFLPTGEEAIFGPDGCGGFGELVNGTSVDDIIIMVNFASIDGPGETVAQAGPCAIRGDDTPAVGILTLDRDDLLPLTSDETVTDIIQHEMAHVIGFGSLWDTFDLLLGAGTSEVIYVGDEGVAAYQAATGATDSIPVESGEGEGTDDAHWDEDVFDEEIMTGFVEADGVDMPLSAMTIASFADLGYEVDLSAADPDPLALRADGEADRPNLGYDILGDWPIIVLDRDATGRFLNDLRSE